MIYLGQDPIGITTEPNVSGKADKVANATNGNFAALDSNGNLTDSGHSNADYVQKTDYPPNTGATAGVVKVDNTYSGVSISGTNTLVLTSITDAVIKNGTSAAFALNAKKQHQSVFYGLAKAAGDTTQSQSDNAVGTYTDDAKTSIRTMLGTIGIADYATSATAGVVKVNPDKGTGTEVDTITVRCAISSDVKAGQNQYKPIVPNYQHHSVFYGLAKAAGADMANSSNSVGTYTSDAKAAIQTMLGVESGVSFVEQVTGTTPVITGIANTRYVCGEVTSISITPPATGIIDVTFTSGTTPAVLTIPNTVTFPAWFDPTTLDANKVYEINIVDGVRGVVTAW